MLAPGDHVPHFEVTSIEGRPVTYAGIWQRRSLAVVVLPAGCADPVAGGVSELLGHRGEFERHQAELVVTCDPISGLMAPAAAIADRWGEIAYAVETTHAADLPRPSELLAWIEHVQNRCPECEGESK